MGYCQIDDEEYLEIQQQIPILTGIGLTILEYSMTTFLITSPFDLLRKELIMQLHRARDNDDGDV